LVRAEIIRQTAHQKAGPWKGVLLFYSKPIVLYVLYERFIEKRRKSD